MPRRTIAVLTDFGSRDTFVGVLKGVIARIAPDVTVIDLSHEVPPHDIRTGALMLLNSYRYFPDGTIFLAIVDPGVGSDRPPIAVQAGGYTFIAPDNGVLSYALVELSDHHAIVLDDPAHFLPEVSATFHGRDIFAPVAAHLAAGAAHASLGTPVQRWQGLPAPLLDVDEGIIRGEVIQIDRFGNAITSIGRFRRLADDRLLLEPAFGAAIAPCALSRRGCTVVVSETRIHGVLQIYANAAPGAALALVGSSGFLELSINLGSFADAFHVQAGSPVSLIPG